MDWYYYVDYVLMVVCYLLEIDDWMMVCIVVFVLFVYEWFEFCKGLLDVDEFDLWQKDLMGVIDVWIEVGQLDE